MSFVAILMGSKSDLAVMSKAEEQLTEFGIKFETAVRSAHRQAAALAEFLEDVESRGVGVYICGAGMSAALPGVVAATTIKPVIGVPLNAEAGLGGLDALMSVAQMPKGVPVACVAVGGAQNAAILAAQILAVTDPAIAEKLKTFKAKLSEV